MSQIIFIQTEKISDNDKNSFNLKLLSDDETNIIILSNTFNDSVKEFIIRKSVVGSKWNILNDSNLINSNIDHTLIEKFLKMLYGYNVSVKLNELYEIWKYAVDTNYSNHNTLLENLEININNLTLEQQYEILLLSANKKNIIEKLSLNQLKHIRTQYGEFLPTNIVLLMFDSALERYKADTKLQQTKIKEQNVKIQEQNTKLNEKTTTNKAPNQAEQNLKYMFDTMAGKQQSYTPNPSNIYDDLFTTYMKK